jgi:hypothetical protein
VKRNCEKSLQRRIRVPSTPVRDQPIYCNAHYAPYLFPGFNHYAITLFLISCTEMHSACLTNCELDEVSIVMEGFSSE